MDFFFLLLVTATLFLRPGEIVPELEGWPIYNYLIIANLILAAPRIINHFEGGNLLKTPATICVLGVFVFIVVSHLARFDFWSARMIGFEFAKVVAYFLLVVSLLNTPRRLFVFVGAIAAFTIALTGLAVLEYHEIVDLPAFSAIAQNDYDELTGELYTTMRLRATGIFNDPNDLSMIIIAAMAICLFGIFSQTLGLFRFALVAPLGFLGYGLALAQSRGGLLAGLAGLLVLFHARFGWKKTALAAAVAVPSALFLVGGGGGGRQFNIADALSGGTGKDRMEIWSDCLQLIKASPVFGVGAFFLQERDVLGRAAHNSFVHCYAELGFFGGTAFVGLFFIVLLSLWRLGPVQHEIESVSLARLRPYLLALVLGVVVSMMSLSRSYIVPTYLVAGLAVAYDRLARADTAIPGLEWNGWLVSRVFLAGVLFIPAIYVYLKIFLRGM